MHRGTWLTSSLCLALATSAAAACDGGEGSELVLAPAAAAASDAGPKLTVDEVDVPLAGLSREAQTLFEEGDRLFGLPLRAADGLGPLYIRASCAACHTEGLRGPGFVEKMSVMKDDGTPADDQSMLTYGATARPNVAGAAKTPIVPPTDPSVRVSTRVGPAVLGRGYMEAVLDSEIERVAAAQASRTDGIRGRINRVKFGSEQSADDRYNTFKKGDVAIGRFGLKARVATLDDFTADALLGDMGITSPLRPSELPNPDGLVDDDKPGIDVSLESLRKRTEYMRMIAIPRRELSAEGSALFARAKCDVCHVPTMKTRADYPIAQLANIDAPIYTDFLLHDMGDALADGVTGVDGEAGPREWRTAPLIGLRFFAAYLHDSRATSVRDAIEKHAGPGSQANESVQLFGALSEEERNTLTRFVEAL